MCGDHSAALVLQVGWVSKHLLENNHEQGYKPCLPVFQTEVMVLPPVKLGVSGITYSPPRKAHSLIQLVMEKLSLGVQVSKLQIPTNQYNYFSSKWAALVARHRDCELNGNTIHLATIMLFTQQHRGTLNQGIRLCRLPMSPVPQLPT